MYGTVYSLCIQTWQLSILHLLSATVTCPAIEMHTHEHTKSAVGCVALLCLA